MKEAERKTNTHRLSPEQYARALLLDGINKGWIGDDAGVPINLGN